MQLRERYDILRQIGRGTTASVFLVRDKHLDKRWVVKAFDVGLLQSKENCWMIQNEINILKQLNDLHMPRAIDLCREPGRVYLVMDYMEGMTLKNHIEQYGPVSEEVALGWMAELCKMILQLHQMEPMLLFCDLKPENVILKKDGRLALIDFGSARFVTDCEKDGFCMTGTKGYTAPELFVESGQWKSFLTPDVDVYSVGAMGLYMSTAMHPINGAVILGEKFREESLLSKPFRKLIMDCMEEKARRIKFPQVLLDKIEKM